MRITAEQVIRFIEGVAARIKEHRDELVQLDSAIGDADHGINMDRGFTMVLGKLPTVADKDIGTILKTVGMTLVSTVGGASGPLYGTAFIRAGMALETVAIESLMRRGRYRSLSRSRHQTWLSIDCQNPTDIERSRGASLALDLGSVL